MVDDRFIEQMLAAGPGAWLASDLLQRLFGSTAEYLDHDLERVLLTDSKQGRNVCRVFAAAMRKLGPRLGRPGTVNPRVLRQVWDEGCYCEDAIAAEYLGGLLAAARTTLGRDDRALPFVRLVRQLSVFDIRLHYLFYTLFRRHYRGRGVDLGRRADRRHSFVYVPLAVYHGAVAEQNNGTGHLPSIVEQAIQSLTSRRLLGEDYVCGPGKYLARGYPNVRESGFVLQPSTHGARLFLFAHGLADTPVRDLVGGWVKLEDFQDFEIAPGSMPLDAPVRSG